jgi:hypothetical protein
VPVAERADAIVHSSRLARRRSRLAAGPSINTRRMDTRRMGSFATHRSGGRVLRMRWRRPRAPLATLVAIVGIALGGCAQVPIAKDVLDDLPGTPIQIVPADVTGDGIEDLVVGYDSSYWGATVFAQDPYGFWRRLPSDPFLITGELMAATDVDADGRADILAASRSASLVELVRAREDGTFDYTTVTVPSASRILALATGAIGGERVVAIAYEREGGGRAVATYLARNGGLEGMRDLGADPGDARVMTFADISGDDRPDLLIGAADGTVRIHRATSIPGAFESAGEILDHPNVDGAVTALATGDVPPVADGRLDIIAGFDSKQIFAWSRGADGRFSGTPTELPSLSEGPLLAFATSPDEAMWVAIHRDTKTIGTMGSMGYNAMGAMLPCVPRNATVLAPNPAVSRFPGGVAIVCDEAVAPVVVARSRVGAPDEIAFGSHRVGTATEPQVIELTAPDVPNVNPQFPVLSSVRLEGPDAGDFELVPMPEWCLYVPTGNCIKVVFDPQSPGPKHARVVISTSGYRAPGAPPHSVELTGTGTGAVAATDPSLALGDVRAGKTRTATLTIRNTGNEPLRVDGLDLDPADGAWSAVRGTCANPVAPGGSCQATVTFAPTATGAAEATLTVRSDSVLDAPTVALSARGTAPAVAAASVAFGQVRVGERATRSAVIENAGTAPLAIADLALEGPDADAFAIDDSDACRAAPIPPGDDCAVPITVAPSARGALDARLRVDSDAPGDPARVTLSATGVQGVLDAPATASLGDVRVGTTGSATLRLANAGDAPLRIATLDLDGAMDLAADTCAARTLAPEAACQVTVRFAPAAPGEARARLTVTHDGVGAEHAIALDARALPADAGDARPGTPPTAPSWRPPFVLAPTRLSLRAPARVAIVRGRRRDLRVVVRNDGGKTSGPLRVEVRLPSGVTLLGADRRRAVPARHGVASLVLDELAAGRSRAVTLPLAVGRRARRGDRRLAVRVAWAHGTRGTRAVLRLRIR